MTIVLLVLGGCAKDEVDERRRAYWLWGQSNQVGGGGVSDLSSENLGYVDAFPCVTLTQRLGNGANPNVWDEYPAEPLQPKHAIGVPNGLRNSFGVELSLGRGLSENWDCDEIVLVKFAVNGTQLQSEWKPGSAPMPGETQPLYDQALAFSERATAELEATVEGLVWIQGNSDANARGPANNYAENLTILLDTVRADVGQDIWMVLDQLPTAVVAPYTNVVREEQALFAASVPGVIMIPTEGLTLRDENHYMADSFIELGIAMGKALGAGGDGAASAAVN